MPSSLQGSSPRGAQSILSRSEKERQSCWSSSPMGQRRKGTFHRASSYLLPQLVHRSVESDADGQDCGDEGEGEVESEESSESEMLNLEEEFDGVLREEVVANALHQLGRSGSGTEQVYLNLTLSGCGLIDISILCEYVHLQKLDLSLNKIEDLSCVSCMPYLLELNASHNKLTTFFNFKPPKNLKSNNQIEKMTGLEELKALQVVDLSHNQISSLQGLENHDFLEVINLEDNKIAELGEIDYLENLPLLRVVNFLRNPVQEKSEYWLFVIFMLLQLTELDQKKIKVEEKVAAVNRYNPPPEVVAAQDHLTHVLNSVMQPQRIFDSTLPRLDAPYPMLVLAGPEACGKRELAHRLCRQLSAYFRYGACHTTRPPYFGEGDRVDYHFISQEVFDEMVNMGKFILTFNYGNHNYGLSRDTIEAIARDGLASCVHMEIEGVRSLKYSYFEPRYILVVPMNKEKYEGYLRRKGLFSRLEIEFAVSRVDLYVKINQQFPGYFDAVINADDLDAAYQKLSRLIREYLGLSEETSKDLAPTADVETPQLKSEEASSKLTATSLCDFLDATDRNYFVKLWAKLSAKKTPVERDSMERQYETARQALMGKIPPHHTVLFQRGLVPAPIINGLHYFTAFELQKNFDLSEDYFKTPFGPYSEKSGKESHIIKSYSTLFHASPWSKKMSFQPPEGSICSYVGSGISESEADETLKVLRKQSFPHEKVSVKHRRHMMTSVVSQPGLNTKLILPPIPQGCKWTNG
ncbi:leucine-rich repeat and guanylate kinase domain-containing protein isoform X2 [Prionailurus viverrinus]|uniref:leucine-rich repeat and guanylate kinase domain-containing protein isoform X2 n=1 Tax=Prionailurus viverrinus TaxID=61388 RepID=UPI001FF47C91|nr:leucine-rich repeat and guanylate kinase domain-containing protein isoform X2 [Prionailurus viverrinus]